MKTAATIPGGFTLIELLTALLILSALALMSYRGLGAVLDAREHVTKETDKWRRVAAFFARFERDIQLAAPRPVRTVSGIAAAYILGISRAVGETMIVAVAAGMQPNLTWNPAEPAATITAYIVQVALGDLPHGSIGYQTIFAAGLSLMLLTLLFNVVGHFMKRRYRQVY